MADDNPFAPLPEDFTWLKREKPEVRPAWPQMPQISRYRGELKNQAPRLGDALMGTQHLEQLAGEVGKADNWLDRLLAMAGIATGVVQGRHARRGSQGKPLPENVGIPRDQRPGVKEKPIRPEPAPRDVDEAGFYLKSLETLKNITRKQGSAASWRNEFVRHGVKQNEMDALKLDEFFAANPHASRDQLIEHVKANRPQIREKVYGGELTPEQIRKREEAARPFHEEIARLNLHELSTKYGPEREASFEKLQQLQKQAWDAALKAAPDPDPIKWKRAGGQDLLLDPSNPTNREIVVHEPDQTRVALDGKLAELKQLNEQIETGTFRGSPEAASRRLDRLEREAADLEREHKRGEGVYRESHFPNVPNYLFHLRTGQYKDAQGHSTLLGDELQSTRAQAIRDSEQGPRDEAKIAELQKRYDDQVAKADAYIMGEPAMFVQGIFGGAFPKVTVPNVTRYLGDVADRTGPNGAPHFSQSFRDQAEKYRAEIARLVEPMQLYDAELRAAKQAPSGHPLVNDMNQTNLTGLRKLIIEGARSGADGISLTPGDLQNARYNLSQHISALRYDPRAQELEYVRRGEDSYGPENWERFTTADQRYFKPDELSGVIGKEMAERLLAQPRMVGDMLATADRGVHRLENLENVEIGGHGMRKYYDETYPNTLDKELKRLDPQWPGRGETHFRKADDPGLFHHGPKGVGDVTSFSYFPLTPKIREEVAKGLPLFSAAALAAMGLGPQKESQEVTEDSPFGPSAW